MISKGKNLIIVVVKKAYWVTLGFRNRLSKKTKNIWKKIISLPKKYTLDLNLGDSVNTVLVIGSGRSGSTWIANLINHSNNYRLIFEPFHHAHCPYMKNFPEPLFFGSTEDISPMQEQILDNIVRGKYQLQWMNKFNRRILSTKRIIKSIRAHYLLDWFWNTLQPPIVFLMRHPLAVVASRMAYYKIDASWAPNLTPITQNEPLMKQLDSKQQELVRAAITPFQQNLSLWCVQNFIALQQLATIPHCLVFYEEFYNDPIVEVKRIYKFLKQPFKKKNIRNIRKLAKIRYIDVDKSKNDSLSKWQGAFSEEEKKQAEVYLRTFWLDKYYSVTRCYPMKEVI
jgi:hypothetical protein